MVTAFHTLQPSRQRRSAAAAAALLIFPLPWQPLPLPPRKEEEAGREGTVGAAAQEEVGGGVKRTHQKLASSAWPTVMPLAHAGGCRCRFRWRGRIVTFALSAGTAARASVAARRLRGLRGETNSGWLSLKRQRGSSTILSLLNPFLSLLSTALSSEKTSQPELRSSPC